MTSAEFIEAVRERLDIGDRQVRFDNRGFLDRHETVFIHYFNLPVGIGGAGGGAEAENNRVMLAVTGFGRRENEPAPGKVKVGLSVCSLTNPHASPGANYRERRWTLRGKSGAPEAIARYVAEFLNKTAAEVPPHFTHTLRVHRPKGEV